jgi:hypothetical protein
MRQLLHIRFTRLNSHQFVCDYLLMTLFLCDVKLSFQIKTAKTNKQIMKKKQRGRCKLKMSKEIIKIK